MERPHVRHVLGAAALALAPLTTACGDTGRSGHAGPVPAVEDRAHEHDFGRLAPAPYPRWDARSRRRAEHVAATAVRRFVSRSVDALAWWRNLRPLLSPAAADAYRGVAIARTSGGSETARHVVTGRAELAPGTSPYLARVGVPTDQGAYRVLLSRKGQGSPWLVERFIPPSPRSR